MGNEMGNNNVSGLQEEDDSDHKAPNMSFEAPTPLIDAENVQDKNMIVTTSAAEEIHGNEKGSSDSANLLVTGDHLTQSQALMRREQDDPVPQASNESLEVSLPTSDTEGAGDGNLLISPTEAEYLQEKLKNPDSLDLTEAGNPQTLNSTSGAKEQDKTMFQGSDESSEALVPTSNAGEGNENLSTSPSEADDLVDQIKNPASSNSSEIGDHQIQNKTSGRGQDDTAIQASEDVLKALMPIININAVGDESSLISPPDADDLLEKIKIPASVNPSEKEEHEIQNQTSNEEDEYGTEPQMESEHQERDEQEPTIDICPEPSFKHSSTVLERHPSAIEFIRSSTGKADGFGDSGEKTKLGRATASQVVDIETEEVEAQIVELNICERDSIEFPTEKWMQSFYLEAIESEMRRIYPRDDVEAIENMSRITLNEYGQSPILISEQEVKESADESKISKKDNSQTNFSIAGDNEESKAYGDDASQELQIKEALQADEASNIENRFGIELHESSASSGLEGSVKESEQEREETMSSLSLLDSIHKAAYDKMIEGSEDDSKGKRSEGIKQVNGTSEDLCKDHEPNAARISEEADCIGERELSNVGLSPSNPIQAEMDLVEPSPASQDGLPDVKTEHAELESKTPEGKEALADENQTKADITDSFGIYSGSQTAETSGMTREIENEEPVLDPAMHQNNTQMVEISLQRSDVPFAQSMDLPKEQEPSCCLTEIGSVHNPNMNAEMIESGERSNTDLNQDSLSAQLDTNDTFCYDFSNPFAESEVAAIQLQNEDFEQNPFLHQTEAAKPGDPASERGEAEQEILSVQTPANESSTFDFAPPARKTEVPTLEAKTEDSKNSPVVLHQSGSVYQTANQENFDIKTDGHESTTFDFAPLAEKSENSALAMSEESEQLPLLQIAATAEGNNSQTFQKCPSLTSNQELPAMDDGSGPSTIDIKNPIAETDFSVTKASQEESLPKKSVESEAPTLERCNSEKLKTPLLSFSKKEAYTVEPLQGKEGLVLKKTADEVWMSPKKAMAAPAKPKHKHKSRYSLFGHCMCCTTVTQ